MPRLFGAACSLDAGLTRKLPNRYPSESRELVQPARLSQHGTVNAETKELPDTAQVTQLQRTLDETSHEMERICKGVFGKHPDWFSVLKDRKHSVYEIRIVMAERCDHRAKKNPKRADLVK